MENCVTPGLDEFDVLLEVILSLVRVTYFWISTCIAFKYLFIYTINYYMYIRSYFIYWLSIATLLAIDNWLSIATSLQAHIKTSVSGNWLKSVDKMMPRNFFCPANFHSVLPKTSVSDKCPAALQKISHRQIAWRIVWHGGPPIAI